MKRIAVVGISGSGKSVFARRLAATTGLPPVHMDQLIWKDKWIAAPEREYQLRHAEALQGDRWIIEGYIDAGMATRVVAADLVIYLDYSGLRCAWRTFTRWLRHRKTSRPELPREAVETLDLEFIWQVLRRRERPAIEACLASAGQDNTLRLSSPRQLRAFMKSGRDRGASVAHLFGNS